MSSVIQEAIKVAKEFDVSDKVLNDCVDHFIWATEHGLRHHTDLGMPMIPTFVTKIPTGKEKGVFLAGDLGGTNFRVCSVTLNGDSTYSLKQEKSAVPHSIMVGNSKGFWDYLAERIAHFLAKHHADQCTKDQVGDEAAFKMGFTFSFPVDQTALNSGTLIRWTKGYDIKDAVGTNICVEFQKAIDARNLSVHVVALVNDTVGTLMSRSYTKADSGQTLVGCIFGTGTNGAYSEKIKAIPKFDAAAHPEITDKIMVINTEWGSFDNRLKFIPCNKYDTELNENTPNKGYHMFEKRISGMFLGELLRLVLVDLKAQGLILSDDQNFNDSNALNTPWSLDSAVPSNIDADDTADLRKAAEVIEAQLGYSNLSLDQLKAVQILSRAIGRRSATLSAVPIAGLILHTKALEKFEGHIDIGADGSVVEFYPRFEEMLREALRKTKLGSEGEKRVTLGLAKDGSGVGAALCALSA